jgi:hypothetical protein
MSLLRSRSTLLLLAALVLALGCRATSQIRLGSGMDHDFIEAEEDSGDLGDPGAEGEHGPRVDAAEETPITPATNTESPSEAALDEDGPTALPLPSSAPAPDPWAAAEPLRNLLEGRRLTHEGRQGPAAWSEDGTQVLFQAVRSGGLVENPWQQTWLMDSSGERQRRITMGVGTTNRPTFVPGRAGVVSYASTHHTGSTPGAGDSGAEQALRGDLDLYTQDLNRGTFTALTSSPGYDGDAAWCADGSRVAFTSERTGDPELFTMGADGSGLLRVTHRAGADVGVSWSPDCSRLAWSAHGPEGATLMVGASDGSEAAVVLSGAGRHLDPVWMPDGAALVFSSDLAEPGGSTDLYAIALRGGALKRLTATPQHERHPVPSPDGGRLLYTSDAHGDTHLYVADVHADAGSPWPLGRLDP